MAFTEFYIQSGGDDANSGTTTSNSASVTVTNASWDITADTFIGLTGTEFASVNVGDWASVFIDGGTIAVYIAQVTAVGALGVSITLSTTMKYGAKPSSGATGRTCKVGGAHAHEIVWTSSLGTAAIPTATRINWKTATYNFASTRTFGMPGTTLLPFWIRGYNTTPGDCDSDPTLARPTFNLSGNLFTLSGAFQTWSSINMTASRSGTGVTCTGASLTMLRCDVENTSSNAAAIACTFGAGNQHVESCWFKTPTTATSTGTVASGGSSNCIFIGCVFEGGGVAGFSATSISSTLLRCTFLSNTGSGLLASTAVLRVDGCTFVSPTGDGIKWTGTPGAGSYVGSSIFSSCGGAGINNNSGANTGNVVRVCNDFYNCTPEIGFGDVPSLFEQAESSSPFVSSPTDLTLASAAVARQKGAPPGTVENKTYTNYLSCGAVQPTSAAGGTTQVFSVFD